MTNAGDMDELFAAVITNKKFMFSSAWFCNEDMMQFLGRYPGLHLKRLREERGYSLYRIILPM